MPHFECPGARDAGRHLVLEDRVPYLPANTDLSSFNLKIVNNTLDCKHVLYNAAHVASQGHERQSVHRNMRKILGGPRTLTIFFAENYGLVANDGTNTIILPGSSAQPWVPLSIDLRHGNFFLLYSDLIHDGGVVHLLLPSDSWRKVGFLELANFPITYQFTQGIRVPFGALEKHRLEFTKHCCAMPKGRKNPTDKCFVCKTNPLCKNHAARVCPACETLKPRQA